MSYPGGKAAPGVFQTIINLIPPHHVYIEPFLGAGAVMRLKAPAACSIGVDIDYAAIAAIAPTIPMTVKLICADALAYLDLYPWTGTEFVYCDPPYLMEVRSSKRKIYRHEFSSIDQHEQLLSLLLKLPAAVMISGYPSDLYSRLLPTWELTTFNAVTRSGRTAKECLWMNYRPPQALHDYRYLGRDFRERERIKRRQHRWKRRLVMMDPLERAALLLAIQDLGTPSP